MISYSNHIHVLRTGSHYRVTITIGTWDYGTLLDETTYELGTYHGAAKATAFVNSYITTRGWGVFAAGTHGLVTTISLTTSPHYGATKSAANEA